MSTTVATRIPILLLACTLLACEKHSSDEGDPKKGVEAVVDKAVDDATKQAGAEHLFDPADKELRKRACEFMTKDMVAGLFGVPAAELQQMSIMGCMYMWKKNGQVLDAKLMSIRVHKSAQMAATWFKNATANKTKAQLDAEMDSVKAKVQKQKELDTELKKKTAANLTDVAKMGMPDEGVSYQNVPGIGDEARVSNADGAVWVRLRNMTFHVSAFKGPEQPRPEFDPKNIKGIAKAAMESQKKWMKDTLEQRKKDAMKLAPLVVKALSAA